MELTITNTTETFDSWLEKDFVDEKLRETLSKASILILPFENLRDTKNPLMLDNPEQADPSKTEAEIVFFK